MKVERWMMGGRKITKNFHFSNSSNFDNDFFIFNHWTYAKMDLFDFKSPSPPLVRGIYGIFA